MEDLIVLNDKELKNLIGKMSKNELIKLISFMIRHNENAEMSLLEFFQSNPIKENKSQVYEKLIMKKWAIALRIIEKANEFGGSSDEDIDEAAEEVDELLKLINEHDISWSCRKDVLNEMLVQIDIDNSCFTDMLVDSAEALCRSVSEKEYMADALSRVSSEYYRGYAATLFRKLGNNDRFISLQSANLRYASDYLRIVDYYDGIGDHTLAMKTAWEGLNKADGILGEIYAYLFKKNQSDENTLVHLYESAKIKKWNLDTITELMYGYYKKKGNYSKQIEMLLNLMSCCEHKKAMSWYEQCRLNFKPSDWEKHEIELTKILKERDIRSYLNLRMSQGYKQEVLELILKQPVCHDGRNLDASHAYSKLLIDTYPNEILERYWYEIRQYINQGKESGYGSAAFVLKEVRTIMNKQCRTEEWHDMYENLKKENRRKSLFMRILEARM